jgi:hypothetical protein
MSRTRVNLLALAVAIVTAAVWPATIFGLPFIVMGLAVIWLPNNRYVARWIARGLPTVDSPPLTLAVVGWLFLVAMPIVMWYLMPG